MEIETVKVAALGECMIELSSECVEGASSGSQMNLGFGGDTLNTAVYLSRLGISVSYVTSLGDDSFSENMILEWQAEGIDCRWVKQVTGRLPGLYMIETDERGERQFHYWRDQSPARELLDDAAACRRLFAGLMAYDYLYLSGITLSLYSPLGIERLFVFLAAYRVQGGQVIFDGNFRPNRWPDLVEARRIFSQALDHTDIALPTFDDERLLFGDENMDATILRLRQAGIQEIVVKHGAHGCLVYEHGNSDLVASEQLSKVVDTTAAGDSFNGAYIAARISGKSAVQAARVGHKLAAAVIAHRGAILPRDNMRQFKL